MSGIEVPPYRLSVPVIRLLIAPVAVDFRFTSTLS
jgi:hypothetical protein